MERLFKKEDARVKHLYENHLDQSEVTIDEVNEFLLGAKETFPNIALDVISETRTSYRMKTYFGNEIARAARDNSRELQVKVEFEAGSLDERRQSKEIMLGFWALNIMTAKNDHDDTVNYQFISVQGLEEELLYATRLVPRSHAEIAAINKKTIRQVDPSSPMKRLQDVPIETHHFQGLIDASRA